MICPKCGTCINRLIVHRWQEHGGWYFGGGFNGTDKQSKNFYFPGGGNYHFVGDTKWRFECEFCKSALCYTPKKADKLLRREA